MEEKLTMDDYATELEASFRKVQEGDVLTGTVIGVSETPKASSVWRIIPKIRHFPLKMTYSWEKR